MQTIKFYYNKRIVYQTIFLCALLFFVFLYKSIDVARSADIFFYAFISLCSLLLGIFFFKRYVFPMLKSGVAIELNETAIVDYSKARIIKWDEVESVVPVKQFLFKKYTGIAIELYNEEHYYNSLTFYKQLNASITKMLYNTPIVIHLAIISYDSEEIVLTFQDCLKKIKDSN